MLARKLLSEEGWWLSDEGYAELLDGLAGVYSEKTGNSYTRKDDKRGVRAGAPPLLKLGTILHHRCKKASNVSFMVELCTTPFF